MANSNPYTRSEWHDTMSEKWKEAPEVLRQIRLCDADRYFSLNHNVFLGRLHDSEMFWVKIQPYLLSNGFQLRPRFRPEWIPSWRDRPHERLIKFEDSLVHYSSRFIDAVCLSDGSQVVIKVVDNKSLELPIIRYLSSSACRSDRRNRTVPVHAILQIPEDSSKVLLVMPLLLRFDELPFRHFGEVVEALEQFLEGLMFMHEHKIAHRDACRGNLMMDISPIMPEGFHFGEPLKYDALSYRELKWKSRSSARPIQYYFIDFDISKHYTVDEKLETLTGLMGQDRTVPELLDNKPYDPFKVDVYQLGNAFLAKVIPEYNGLEVLVPILKAMTNSRPEGRPSPSETLKMLGDYDDRILQQRVWLKKYSMYERLRIRYSGTNPV